MYYQWKLTEVSDDIYVIHVHVDHLEAVIAFILNHGIEYTIMGNYIMLDARAYNILMYDHELNL